MTVGELEAAVRWVAQEQPEHLRMMLWALANSPELQAIIALIEEPDALAYNKLSEQDPAIFAFLSASSEGRDLLNRGHHQPFGINRLSKSEDDDTPPN